MVVHAKSVRVIDCNRQFATDKYHSAQPDKIRNIGIIAHVDAGKTTTSERMLFYSGESNYLGDVDKGDTMLDYLKMERERGITINSAVITFCWKNHFFNLIDTPGHVDFTVEVERSVGILDGCIVILDGTSGVQVQTESVWVQVNRYSVPRIAYINKMDRDTASVHRCLESIERVLRVSPLPIQIPIGFGKSFCGTVDLVEMQAIEWDTENLGSTMTRYALDSDTELGKAALKSRQKLIENCASLDDTFMSHILDLSNDDGQDLLTHSHLITPSALREVICRITQSFKAIPVLMGSSLSNIGVQTLMDSIIDYLPPPTLKPLKRFQVLSHTTANSQQNKQSRKTPLPITLNPDALPCDSLAPLVAQAFKTVHNKKINQMITYCRVYSGTLLPNMKLFNVNKNTQERSFCISRVYADRLLDLDRIVSGDIGAISGLVCTETGDTLVGLGDPLYIVQKMKIPQPVFWMSVLSDSASNETHLRQCLDSLQLEDPSFNWMINSDTSQWLMGGMGELHMEVLKDRLLNYYKAKATVGPIQIAYKSTINTDIASSFSRDYIIGPKTESPTMELSLESIADDGPASFCIPPMLLDDVVNMPKETKKRLLGTLSKAAQTSISSGTPTGFPLAQMKITLTAIVYDPTVSIHSYKLCLHDAISSMVNEAGIQILEPIMKVEMLVNEEHLGKVITDLSFKRRATISQVEGAIGSRMKTIYCFAPLVELVGYLTELRSLSKGTASFTMKFSHHGRVNSSTQQQILQN